MKEMRARMLQTFLAEARDLVVELEEGLRRLKAGDHSPDLVDRLFRAAHSIKGSGGMFGLAPLVGFTHVVENLLERIRAGTLAPCEQLVADLQDSCDHIADLVECLVAQGGHLDDAALARDLALRAALARHDATAAAPLPPPPVEDMAGDGPTSDDVWHVSVHFGTDVHNFGINPLTFLRELAELGELVNVVTIADRMPEPEAMDPEACYLGFEVDIRTSADKQRIVSVFEFVEDCSLVRVIPPRAKIEEFIQLIRDMPGPGARLGDVLVEAGTLTRAELEAGLAAQRERALHEGLKPALGSVLVENQLVAPTVVQAALDRQNARPVPAPPAPSGTTDSGFVRVRAEDLDQLINLIGELVIAGASASLLADRSGASMLREAQSTVSSLMEEIRERAMRMRMVPIGETFSRFHRVVREIGRELGKDIDLVIEGSDTELDKAVVEKIADPLVHLVRNAADHGIESAPLRQAAGKPAQGRIRLSARHEGATIVIEIHDDGGGLDRERILSKALERGLMAPTAQPNDHEILQLIFEPGFSTATEVTSLSGRGVGMDVVRRNIAALRGTIELHSPPGCGTTVRIRLPLTLAIIDGFLVGVGEGAFVLPLDQVVECVEMPEDFPADRGYLDLRGVALPLVRLRDDLQLRAPRRSRRENVVVVDCGSHAAGFVVDELLGEFQTVIKPLGPMFEGLRGISGSTILGGGEVALILDVPELAAMSTARESLRLSARQSWTPVDPVASITS